MHDFQLLLDIRRNPREKTQPFTWPVQGASWQRFKEGYLQYLHHPDCVFSHETKFPEFEANEANEANEPTDTTGATGASTASQ